MIHGCASGNGADAEPPPVAAVVIDNAAVRCPQASEQQRRTLTHRVAPPKADAPEGVTRDAWRAKTDELRRDGERKAAVGLQLADELDRCSTGGGRPRSAPAPPSSAQRG